MQLHCRETALLIDEGSSSAQTRQWVALVVSHELAHQWFGNLVTMVRNMMFSCTVSNSGCIVFKERLYGMCSFFFTFLVGDSFLNFFFQFIW